MGNNNKYNLFLLSLYFILGEQHANTLIVKR